MSYDLKYGPSCYRQLVHQQRYDADQRMVNAGLTHLMYDGNGRRLPTFLFEGTWLVILLLDLLGEHLGWRIRR